MRRTTLIQFFTESFLERCRMIILKVAITTFIQLFTEFFQERYRMIALKVAITQQRTPGNARVQTLGDATR